MSTPTLTRLPKFCHFKPKDLAVVRIDGEDRYLGKYDSPESHEKYRRVLAEWLYGAHAEPLRPAGKPDAGPTLDEVILSYVRFAEGDYRKEGVATGEVAHIKYAGET
jgi:hypothetical protein